MKYENDFDNKSLTLLGEERLLKI